MIVIEKLTKNYGSLAALRELTLTIAEGEIFGFVGPNGAGKTTTMRILATLLEPTRGKATIDGKDVRGWSRAVRRLVGYMPDFMGIYEDLKVIEYLDFFAAAFEVPRRKRRGIVEGILELTDLRGKAHTPVDSLSRGMQQRLGLARVLVHDPKVLILDEPASGLDPRARIEIRELLLELKAMGKTIMISSHILSELELICDKIGIIELGQLVFHGPMAELRARAGHGASYNVTVAGPNDPAIEALSTLPNVREVTGLDECIRVRFTDGAPGDGAIARALVNAGISLLSLVPEDVRLEDAFMELTKGIVS